MNNLTGDRPTYKWPTVQHTLRGPQININNKSVIQMEYYINTLSHAISNN